MDNVFEIPKLKTADPSLNDFLTQVQTYRADIMKIHPQVLHTYNLFGGSRIWADQIDRVINTIRTMNESVQEFCELLSPIVHLPVIVGPLRYPLMKTLYQIDGLISDLICNLTLFRPICRSASRKAITEQQEIQRKLESLLQCLEQLDQNVEVLPERIALQEKILSNA